MGAIKNVKTRMKNGTHMINDNIEISVKNEHYRINASLTLIEYIQPTT